MWGICVCVYVYVCVCVCVEKEKRKEMILLGFKPFQQGPKKRCINICKYSVIQYNLYV